MQFFILSWIVLGILLWNTITRSDNLTDFQDYFNASRKFYQKEDIYSIDKIKKASSLIESPLDIFLPENISIVEEVTKNAGSYIYPPTFAFLLIPLSLLDYQTASFIFSLLSYMAFVGVLSLLYKLSYKHSPNPSIFWTVLFFSLVINFRFLENHINNNQVSFLLLFFVLASLVTQKSWLSGLLLSLATVIKITPLAFFFYFFWKKKWAVLIWGFIFLLFWIFLPGLFFWEENLKHLQAWNQLVLKSALSSPLFRSWQNNQSLVATLAKYFLDYADPIHQLSKGLPFVSLPIQYVQWTFYGFVLGFGIHFLYIVYFRKPEPSESKVLSLLFVLSVVFSGISWIHSFSFLLVPVFYVVKEWMEGGLSSKQKFSFLVFSSICILINRNIIGSYLESWSLMLSFFLYGAIILYFVIASIDNDDWNFPSMVYNTNNLQPSKTNQFPIKVAVDARPLAYGMTGNSRYLAEVLKILGNQKNDFIFYLYSHKNLHPVFHSLLELPAIQLVTQSSWIPGPIWLHTVFLFLAKKKQVHKIWGTLQILPAWKKFCPMIVNFHDLNVKVAPQTMEKWNYFQHKIFCRRTLKIADSILCLSKSTQQDIQKYYPFAGTKTILVYPGVSKSSPPKPPTDSHKFHSFLFTLGTLEPRKNLKTLINAYLDIKKENPSYPLQLVIGGRSGWGIEENKLEEELKQGLYQDQGVYFILNPSEEELTWLYKNCFAFVFPSIHEGFGLPLLEAMKENKNCIASNIPVFKEICNPKYDILVPPLDQESWKHALIQIYKNPPLKRKWNPNQWTWKETSKKIEFELKK